MLFRLVLQYLLSFCMLGFAAGASVVDIGGGGDGSLVDTGSEGTSDSEGGETEDTSDSEVETEGQESTEQKTTAAKTTEKLDLRTVPQDVKSHLQEIGKTNSKLANFLQNSIYTSQAFLKEFPAGIKEVQALKGTLEELGGIEEVKTLRETHQSLVEEQEQMDRQAQAGDPAILDNLVKIAGKDGFAKLMPVAMDRWRNEDPSMYSHSMAKIMVSALTQGNVVADLNLAFRMLNLKDGVGLTEGVEALKRVANSINEIGTRANKAPEKPKVDPQIAREQENINNEKSKLFNEKFQNQFEPWRNGRIKSILREIAPKGRNFTDYQIQALIEKTQTGLREVLSGDDKYVSALERLYSAKNMEELLKFTKNRTDKVLKTAVTTAYNGLFRDFTSKKGLNPGNKVEQKGNTNQKKEQVVVKGWTKLDAAKAPQPDDIDHAQTDFKMKFNKQAILKNGNKVYWGDRVPK